PADGRLACRRVLADLLADERRIAFDIEEIVGDLERLADGGAVAFERRALRGVGLPEDAAGMARELEQRPGLHRLKRGDLALGQPLRLLAVQAPPRGKHEHPAAHPPAPNGGVPPAPAPPDP